jgi:hypothetical protein
MKVSDKVADLHAIARRCPIAALVLSDPQGSRFHLLFLGGGPEQIDRETAASIAAGLTKEAGLVALTRDGQFESLAKTGFSGTITRASAVFILSLLEELKTRKQREVETLEKLAELQDPRQA